MTTEATGGATDAANEVEAGTRWQDLPEPVDPAATVESVPVTDAPDPDGGHDPDHEWMIRHG